MSIWFFLDVVLLWALAANAEGTPQDIWILGMAPFTGGNYDAGDSMRFAGDMMLRLINEEGTILPGYRLRVLWQNERCSSVRALDVLRWNFFDELYVVYPEPPHMDFDGDGQVSTAESASREVSLGPADLDPKPIGILGAGCSSASLAVAKWSYHLRLPMISAASRSPRLSDRGQFPNFFRTISHDGFMPAAICATVRLLGISRMVAAIGETHVWGPLAAVLARNAQAAGLAFAGMDLGAEVPGLKGVQLSSDSWQAALESMRQVQRSAARIVIGIMYAKRYRLLFCAQVEEGIQALVWFTTALSAGSWFTSDVNALPGSPSCSKEDILGAASGLMVVLPNVWRPDLNEGFACSSRRTVGEFRREFYVAQGSQVGVNTRVPGNYSIMHEAPATADAVCMYALMLREMLFTRNWSLADLATRGPEVYPEIVDVLGTSNFQGLQGQLHFMPGMADPSGGSIVVYQLQASASPCTGAGQCGSVDDIEAHAIATFNGGVFHFLGADSLKFHYPDEVYTLPRPGAASDVTLALPDFSTCPTDHIYNPMTRQCETCADGQVFIGDLGDCVCTSGFRKANKTCVPCAAGTFSSRVGGTACESCPTGHFAATRGQSSCTLCPLGTFAAQLNAAECTHCGEGRNNAELWTTMRSVAARGGMQWVYTEGAESSESCGCNRDSRRDSSGECIPCEEGLSCVGMGDVIVLPGYFSEVGISVYRCHGESSRCAGGSPGATCNEGREGITCAVCESGKMPGKGGTCQPCGNLEVATPAIAVMVALVAISGSYHIVARSTGQMAPSDQAISFIITLGLLMTALQVLGIVGRMPFAWEEPLRSTLEFLQLFVFDIEIFRVGCLGQVTPLGIFAARILIIIFACAWLVVVHCFSVLVWHGRRFGERKFALKCAVGTLFMTFSISVVSVLVAPWQCDAHPNGKWTMHQYPGVLCWESEEHESMIIIGVIALLCIPLPFMAKCAAVVRAFPKRMQMADTKFLKENSFIVFRFRPQVYWYSLIVFGRGLLIAALLAIPSVSAQILLLALVMFATQAIDLHFAPWRTRIANVFEAFIASLILFFCSVTMLFVECTPSDIEALSVLCMVLFIAVLLPFPLTLGNVVSRLLLLRRKRFQFFLCHHKAGAGAFVRLLKMSLMESSFVKREVFVDSDNLENLSTLFDLVGNHTETLVIVASHQVFHRPWCVGEMTVARCRKLRAVAIVMPDGAFPDDDFVTNFEEKVSNIGCLSAEGISVPDIQQTLLWTRDLPRLELRQPLTATAIRQVTAQLCGVEVTAAPSISTAEHEAFILSDPTDLEAVSAAHVLHKMVRPQLVQAPNMIPIVLSPEVDLPKSAKHLLVLFSSGLLEQRYVWLRLMKAADFRLHVLPVTLDAAFRYPTPASLATFCRDVGPDAADVLKQILQEISVPFQPQSAAKAVLDVSAKEVVRRLLRTTPANAISRTEVDLAPLLEDTPTIISM
mmetsp:Transcript_80860/g.237659  ORF Transcript_80860/g.237659 Transcript_80860/m.237659 type:complete len:1458 (-) Transcript_80860:181-4554(-)